jgi:hypothetical protein
MHPPKPIKTALIPARNLQHNVPTTVASARRSLGALADLYFRSQVAGQAAATLDAKRRDLGRFLSFYHLSVPKTHVSTFWQGRPRRSLRRSPVESMATGDGRPASRGAVHVVPRQNPIR